MVESMYCAGGEADVFLEDRSNKPLKKVQKSPPPPQQKKKL